MTWRGRRREEGFGGFEEKGSENLRMGFGEEVEGGKGEGLGRKEEAEASGETEPGEGQQGEPREE